MRVLKTVIAGGVGLLGASCYYYFTGSPWFFQHVAMPAVRVLDPETAHRAAIFLASKGIVPRDRTKDPEILHTSVWGKQLLNPIGLAAGFDKHGEAYEALLGVGFGFVEVGSVTPRPQLGNPRPRVFRLDQDKAVINRYGFNSHGHDVVSERLKKRSNSLGSILKGTVVPVRLLGVNLGKNMDSADAAEDYVQGVRRLGAYADYVVVNVSCPNTPGLTDMQGRQLLSDLLDKVLEERDKLAHKPPLLVKIAPDLSPKDRRDIAAVVTRQKGGVDGLIVSNTTISRPASLKDHALSQEKGGLSGAPLRDMATETLSDMYLLTGGRLPIIGVGGVSSGRDAYDKITAGASLVQLYTAMSYEGPTIVSRVKRELAEILKSEGHSTVAAAVGTRHKNKIKT